MSCGLPVISSDCSSLKEITGDAGMLSPPDDIEQIQEHILNIAENKNLKESLGEKSLIQARKFSWIKTAKKTLDIYNKLNLSNDYIRV